MQSVALDRIWKSYDGVEAVKGISFEVAKGEFVGILGPSGCGKSSTLRMIAGLEDITSGELKFDGKVINDLSPKERGIGMGFENYALYQPLTVYRKHRLSARGARRAARRDRSARAPHGEVDGDRGRAGPPSVPALRRPAAACLARPRPGARSERSAS